jgi:hypothetical protein
MTPINIEGFHGTNIKNVEAIIKDGFISSHRKDHWLGQGIYFYDNFGLALWWIKKKLKSSYGHKCGVLRVSLGCTSDRFLDLDTTTGMNYFLREVDKILTNEITDLKFKFATDEDSSIRNLCFALDLLKEMRDIKLVARTFPSKSPEPTYASESIKRFEEKNFILPLNFNYLERQICASSNEVIVEKHCIHPKNRTSWH